MNLLLAYNLDLTSINASAIVVVPIIVAIVQAIKMAWTRIGKFAPLVSIGVGIAISFIADHDSADLSLTLLSGCMYGLMASGLYSGVKETASAIDRDKK